MKIQSEKLITKMQAQKMVCSMQGPIPLAISKQGKKRKGKKNALGLSESQTLSKSTFDVDHIKVNTYP